MAQLIQKVIGNCKLECYSERGILSFFMFHFLPKEGRLVWFLDQIPDFSKHKIISDGSEVRNIVILSEFGLGKRDGFGEPDGAFTLDVNGQRHFFFVEAKFNQTYRESCKGVEYNSTIQGQIELKMRFVDRVFCPSTRYPGYVIEDSAFRDFYKCKDVFYQRRPEGDSLASFRRVKLEEGVGRIVKEYVGPCGRENVNYLIITKDEDNPLGSLEEALRPHFPGKDWDEICGKLCWVPAKFIEELV